MLKNFYLIFFLLWIFLSGVSFAKSSEEKIATDLVERIIAFDKAFAQLPYENIDIANSKALVSKAVFCQGKYVQGGYEVVHFSYANNGMTTILEIKNSMLGHQIRSNLAKLKVCRIPYGYDRNITYWDTLTPVELTLQILENT